MGLLRAAGADGSVHDALRRLAPRAGGDVEAALIRLLERLPSIDWRDVHALADRVGARDGEAAFEVVMAGIYAWLGRKVRSGEAVAPRRLAPFAEVWEKVMANARETDALNLDRRPLVLTIFSDLAAAVRASST